MDREGFRARFEAYKNGKSVSEIYDAGLPKDNIAFQNFLKTLPDNQKYTSESSYRNRRYWELNGKPKDFSEAIAKGMYSYDTSDNGWHANSVALNESTGEYEFMKPNWHNTKMYEDAWYYSKDGEEFRDRYTKQPGVAYDKYTERNIKPGLNVKPIQIGFKDGKLPKFGGGKDDEDPFEVKKQGKLISAAVNRNIYGNRTELNKKHDEIIAKKKAYGWKNAMRTPIHNARQAAEQINPAWGFHDIIPALWSRFVSPTNMKGATPDDKAFWKRHIGFERDLESMPIIGIRFSGDYNKDGSLRLPEAEYTGLSKQAKDFIRTGIENEKLIPKRNGVWTQIHESGLNPGTTRFNPYSKYTSHLGDYSIRQNNDSGIYDIVDTYDFPRLYPVFNRQDGKQIEIRDTIHTKNAIPELYDPMFSATFPKYSNGKSIHINPANRGKFNATKKRTGKTTEELTHSSNPLTRKRAIFAQNAKKWKH